MLRGLGIHLEVEPVRLADGLDMGEGNREKWGIIND